MRAPICVSAYKVSYTLRFSLKSFSSFPLSLLNEKSLGLRVVSLGHFLRVL